MKKILFLLALLGLFAIWIIFLSNYHADDGPVLEKNVVYEEINKNDIGCKITLIGKCDPEVTVYESGNMVNVVRLDAGTDVKIKDVKYFNFISDDRKDIFIEYDASFLMGTRNDIDSTLVIISKVDGNYKVVSRETYFVKDYKNNKVDASGCGDKYEVIDSVEGRIIRFVCDDGPYELIWKHNKLLPFFPKNIKGGE